MSRERWMAVLFAVGSLCFLVGPFPGYVQLVGPGADAATFFAGSLLFTAGGALQLGLSLGGPRAGIWAAAVQSAGTLFFNVTTFAAMHTALTNSDYDRLVWRPDAFGSICFLVSGFIAYAASPRHGWLPRRGVRGWWQPLVNLLGCIFFGISAIAGFVVPASGSILDLAAANWNTALGAACFLACAVAGLRTHRTATAARRSAPATTAAQADPTQTMASRRFIVLLALASVIGVIAALASWCFLELTHQVQVGVFDKLPEQLGYAAMPVWWPVPFAVLAGLIVAFAIQRLPGGGGHVPAHGLSTDPILPAALSSIMLASIATIGLGLVLGPEAPLIALGSGLGLVAVRLVRRDAPPELGTLMAACGTFSALALIFDSPLIASVILIEAVGLGGAQLRLLLIPGLLAAGIGSLVSIGMGSFTGLSDSAYAIGAVALPPFDRPDLAEFLWTVPFGAAIAVGSWAIFRIARGTEPLLARRPFLLLPLGGAAVAGLAVAFSELTGKGAEEVLFDGQDALDGLVSGAASWSLGALALLLVLKGLAWAISLAGFRGGPTFPAMFLGAAAGVAASHLPGFDLTPAVAIGLGAGVASVLRLPLSGVVLAAVLTASSGAGSTPLVIVGVVAAYLTTLALPQPAAHPEVKTVPEPKRTVTV